MSLLLLCSLVLPAHSYGAAAAIAAAAAVAAHRTTRSHSAPQPPSTAAPASTPLAPLRSITNGENVGATVTFDQAHVQISSSGHQATIDNTCIIALSPGATLISGGETLVTLTDHPVPQLATITFTGTTRCTAQWPGRLTRNFKGLTGTPKLTAPPHAPPPLHPPLERSPAARDLNEEHKSPTPK